MDVNSNGSVRAADLDLGYSFTPNLTLSELTQYNNVSHNTSINARLQWLMQPDRILYVVWNHGLTPIPACSRVSRPSPAIP